MNYENPELRDRLAAEYALGTLRGAARRRFQKLMAGDPALRDLTLQWEMRLNDMAASAQPVTPRPQLWQAIQRALGPVARPQIERPGLLSGLWESLGFWRASAFGAAAVAAALVLYIAIGRPVAPETRYIAVLIDETATPVLVASLAAEDGKLSIKSIKPTNVAADKDLELWLVPPQQGASPRSLGVLKGMQALVTLTKGDAADLTQGALAVSLEPAGGSPTGTATGPILYVGAVLPAADSQQP